MTMTLGPFSLKRMMNAVERVRERLHKAAGVLRAAKVPFAVVGGNAVALWVSRVDESAVRTTRNVDVLLRDRFRRRSGGTGIRGVSLPSRGWDRRVSRFAQAKPHDGVHIIYANERVRPDGPIASSICSIRRMANLGIGWPLVLGHFCPRLDSCIFAAHVETGGLGRYDSSPALPSGVKSSWSDDYVNGSKPQECQCAGSASQCAERDERLAKLKEDEKWREGMPVYGLPKVAHRKAAVAKTVKEEAAADATATTAGGAAAPAAGAAAGTRRCRPGQGRVPRAASAAPAAKAAAPAAKGKK